MSLRSGSSSSAMRPWSVMWRYHESPSRMVSDTRGSLRRYPRRLRPSSMFTSARPSSQTYQVATVFGLPSGATVPMIDGFGLRKTFWSASGSGGLGIVVRPTRSARGDRTGGREIDRDRVGDVRRVPAREHDADRCAGPLGRVEHQGVARAQARLRERQAAEAIALPRVGAGQEEDEVGRGGGNGPGERVVQRLEVGLVSGPGREVHVEIGGRAA